MTLTSCGASWVIACAVLCFGCGERGGDILRSAPTDAADPQMANADDAQSTIVDDAQPPMGDAGFTQPAIDAGSTQPAVDAGSAPVVDAGALVSTTAQLDQLLGPWGTVEVPTPIPALVSTFSDDDPTLPSNLLELYFTSTRGNTSTDIYVSKRTATDVPWSAPALVAPLNTSDPEDTPEIAPDGLTIWFVRSVKGTTTGRDVYVATRPRLDAAWSPGKLVPELSSPLDDYAPTPSGDGLTMIMSSYRAPSLGGDDLFASRRASLASPWTVPTWIPVLESTARDSGPFRPGDDTLMYFTTWRSGLQIWRSARPDATSPWATPTVVSELSANQNGAEEPWISSDLRLMVFALKVPNRPTQIAEVRR